jgi:hypothetical protein
MISGIKLDMMRHRSRLWKTFLFCLLATGPALAALSSSTDEEEEEEEGGAVINIIPISIGSG